MSNYAKKYLWLAAVGANLVVAGWFAWAMVLLARHDRDPAVWGISLRSAFLYFGISALSVFALCTFRPPGETEQAN
jgi:hypothetical protein